MNGWMVTGIVVGAVLLDLVVVVALLRGMSKSSIGGLAKQFPAVEPGADAVRRNFQSFKFGIYNAGWCVHVAVDERSLHLMPAKLFRWCGARDSSIPWEAITLEKRGKMSTRVKIGKMTIWGPTWCLELAQPPADSS